MMARFTSIAMLFGITATLLGSPALAGARQQAITIMPDTAERRAFFEKYGFSEAVIIDDTVYISGVVAGQRPEETDLVQPFTRAMDRIGAILDKAGCSWDDVVDMTTYHTDLPAQLDAFNEVKNKYIKAPFPAWTAIGITRLVPDRGITEIKLVAKLPKRAE